MPFVAFAINRSVGNAVIRNRLRRRMRAVLDELDLPADSPIDRARAPVANLEAGERRRRLAQKIGLLRPHHRSVLVLRDLEGLSYDEIAVALDVPVPTVKTRLLRGRRRLAVMLDGWRP